MRVLIHSNAPWAPSGYGVQTALLAHQLQQDGHEIAISAFYGLGGNVLSWNGMRIYPFAFEPYGSDVLCAHAEDFFGGDITAGLIITLIDVYVLPRQLRDAHCLAWCPVDHDPAPRMVTEWLHAAQPGVVPVAMSRFGEQALEDAGFDPAYAPHGVATDVYCPGDKNKARQRHGFDPERKLVLMVGANKHKPARKNFEQAFQAVAQLKAQGMDLRMHVHTEPFGKMDGVDLYALRAALNLEDTVSFPNPYRIAAGIIDQGYMADLYRAADVLLHPSLGEGFGIPIIEAQACGTPVIATEWTAMPELVFYGETIKGRRTFTYQNSWWMQPDQAQLVVVLRKWLRGALDLSSRNTLIESEGDLRKDAHLIYVDYDHEHVYATYWRPLLERMQRRIEGVADEVPEPEVVR